MSAMPVDRSELIEVRYRRISRAGLAANVTLAEATAINDGDLIVANGVDSRTNEQHAYLLDCRHKGKPHKCQ